MYVERLRNNLRRVIEENGFKLHWKHNALDSIGVRHLWNVERGKANITVGMLENVADEIGVDMLEFFRE